MVKIKARAIIEIAGFPKEHVEETMIKVVENLKKDFVVKSYNVYEAAALKDKMEGFWSTFCEIEIDFEKMDKLIGFCFEFLPSSIEILEPKEFNLKDNEFSNLFNDLLSKLHDYDMVVKNLVAQNQIMKKKVEKPSA